MISLKEFIALINVLLICMYIWEVGYYIHTRKKYPAVFAAFQEHHPDFWSKQAVESNEFKGALFIGFIHSVFLFVSIEAISLPFLGLVIGMIYCGAYNEALKPYVRLAKGKGPKSQTNQQQQQQAHAEADEGFGYDPGRFRDAGNGAGQSSYNAEADYEGALREAQTWADSAASEKGANAYAAKFEKLSANPGLHPKDRLRYKLAAMLLRERMKGQAGQRSQAAQPEPNDADLVRLGLPVPKT
ncbi:hypothetical protein [Sinorhizobium medicae]|uniref:hypothetical protein n=1 Tax=Sinorhizobium medicae TaxID=110321 RepID=UPI000C7E6395|nr:hypothetical protein [Sinorhizobium medicae]PLU25720.1 hypothetical protein BMJ28_33450 [Sinorhizobium medicae]